ncbi:MAG: AraC family transcriptional regulator [Bacteroidota bacterium]
MQRLNKAIPFRISKSDKHALLVQLDRGAFFYDKLHYHPEYQITAIEQGEGILYAGNSMTAFSPGDIFLIGPDVPHLLKHPANYYQQADKRAESVSLFFDQQSFGEKFFELSELSGIHSLLQSFRRVIKLTGDCRAIFQAIQSMPQQEEEGRIIAFLQILSRIRRADKMPLNKQQYRPVRKSEDEGGRLNEVLNYTFRKYREDISLQDIIQVACLSRSQFSSFFKYHTGKTYIQFLNELRVENACVLLTSSTATVEQICYEVGFKNVSNFVRQFKKAKETTPSAYRKLWQLK